nr:hypothetical protein BaRGS_028000 [Batillaria attramentaria]
MWRCYRERKAYTEVSRAVMVLQAHIRARFARMQYRTLLEEHKAVTLQKNVRAFLMRRRFRRVMRGIVLVQSHYRRRKARLQLKVLKVEAKSVEHIKVVNKGLENKIIELQQKLDERQRNDPDEGEEIAMVQMKSELQRLKSLDEDTKVSSNKVADMEDEIARLRAELERVTKQRDVAVHEKEQLVKESEEVLTNVLEEKAQLKELLDEANRHIQNQQSMSADSVKEQVEMAKKLLIQEFESERSHHQRLVKEHARLQQRLENLQGEMQVLTSPTGLRRTPSDVSAISIESLTSSADTEKREDEEDQGYETAKRRGELARKASAEQGAEVAGSKKMEDVDIGLLLKLQNKVKDLEKEKSRLMERLERFEEEGSQMGLNTDSAFDTLKKEMVNPEDVALLIKLQKRIGHLEAAKQRLTDELDEREELDNEQSQGEFAFASLKMQELENENDKLKREVERLMKSIAETTNFGDNGGQVSPAAKEFLDSEAAKRRLAAYKDQFEAMTDELERRREECLQLRAMMAERVISTHSIAKDSYGGHDDLVNEDNELEMAYKTQKDLNRWVPAPLKWGGNMEAQ